MAMMMGYSLPGNEGFCVHDDSGTSWGEHPVNYDGPSIFLEDGGVVTAVGRQATEEQIARLQDRPISWKGEVPYDEAVVTADTALDCIVMLHEGP